MTTPPSQRRLREEKAGIGPRRGHTLVPVVLRQTDRQTTRRRVRNQSPSHHGGLSSGAPLGRGGGGGATPSGRPQRGPTWSPTAQRRGRGLCPCGVRPQVGQRGPVPPLVGSASLCREVLLLQLPHLPVWLATSRPFAGSPLGGRNAGGTETMKPERWPRGLASRLPPECLVTSCGAPGHLCGSHLPSGAQTAYSAQEGGFPDQTLMKDEEPRWFL